MEITAKMDSSGVNPLIRMAKDKDFDMELSLAIRDSLVAVERNHRRKVVKKSGKKGSPAVNDVWTSRSGGRGALGSFHREWQKGDHEGRYGSDLERIEKLEHGGDIRPKGKFLAIPTEHAPVDVWPRHVPDLVFIQSLAGQPLLVRPTGGTGFDVLYILRRKVTLPPRPTLAKAVKNTEDEREKIMLDAVENAIWGRKKK